MRLLLLQFIYRSDGRKTAADAAEIAVGAVTAQRKKTGTVSGKMDNKNTEILSKYFDELSLTELYEIIKARVQIFVAKSLFIRLCVPALAVYKSFQAHIRIAASILVKNILKNVHQTILVVCTTMIRIMDSSLKFHIDWRCGYDF